MKKDIPFLPVKDVTLAVVKRPTADEEAEWVVYLINRNDQPLENVMVTSKGVWRTGWRAAKNFYTATHVPIN